MAPSKKNRTTMSAPGCSDVEVTTDEVFKLYERAKDYHRKGDKENAYSLLKNLLPFFTSDPAYWIRVTELEIDYIYGENSASTSEENRSANESSGNNTPNNRMNITKDDAARSSQLALCLAKGTDDKKLITTATLLNAFLAIKQFRFRCALELLEQIPESWWNCMSMSDKQTAKKYETICKKETQTTSSKLDESQSSRMTDLKGKLIDSDGMRVIEECRTAFQNGNKKEALQIFKKYHETHPDLHQLLVYFGYDLYVKGSDSEGASKTLPGNQSRMVVSRLLLLTASRSSQTALIRRLSTKYASQADVVVCGGGIAGSSVAYHLAKRGKKVVLFERDVVGCGGATGLASGLVTASMYWQDPTNQIIADRSIRMYTELSKEATFKFTKCGRLYLASSLSSEILLRRMYSRGVLHHDDVELIDDQSEMLSRWPFLQTEDIQLALYSPEDLVVDAAALCLEIANKAKYYGATIFENCEVLEVLLGDDGQVYAVKTTNGLVETKQFVDASGWTGTVLVKPLPHRHVQTAAYPCTYTSIHTAKLPTGAVGDHTPIINDMDGNVMLHATSYNTIASGFNEESIRAMAKQGTNVGLWHHPEPDWDRFASNLERLVHRFPMLSEVDSGDLICGMEAYTPDKVPTIGESSQARGYYVMNGMNGQGLSLAGGLGELLATWIVEGQPDLDVARLDVGRFIELHANPRYLMERTPEIATMTYRNLYNSYQCHSARNLRMSPIYYQLKDAGAVFGEIMGYERPLWFDKHSKPDHHSLMMGQDTLIGKPSWFDSVKAEYEACRERVGLIDMSSFSKFDIEGPDAVKLLQYLCSANIDGPIGTTVYTGMQHEKGGYVTDCTLSRLGTNKFFMVAPTIQQERVMTWMKKWAEKMNANVHAVDVTGGYTALDCVGPSSRYLMQDITGLSMSSTDFPSFHCQEIDIGMATGIRAISVTHCGELGWVMYIPNEVAQNVYEKIVDAGREYSMLHAGYYTLRQLRIEKFYVYWGQDINATVTPVECGRAFRVDFKKDFIGKAALEAQIERGVHKKFVQLLIDKHDLDTDPWPQGGETLFRNGQPVGLTTSAAYGFTLGCQVCIAYVENRDFGVSPDFIAKGNYELDIAGKRFPVRMNLHSPSLPMISSEHPLHYRPTQDSDID
ncbi:hypothetical protein WR25_15426 [Diploscapter pachys]|uniref:FAD dependent oxidoreductase domain-containing protein n=1 Tax=Diploscapter pachys TaxID=2018661 RepID=A0A2A2LN34_9BILA|nr:hypothetical protein WR25_15426 [Diploscapter pachys]